MNWLNSRETTFGKLTESSSATTNRTTTSSGGFKLYLKVSKLLVQILLVEVVALPLALLHIMKMKSGK